MFKYSSALSKKEHRSRGKYVIELKIY